MSFHMTNRRIAGLFSLFVILLFACQSSSVAPSPDTSLENTRAPAEASTATVTPTLAPSADGETPAPPSIEADAPQIEVFLPDGSISYIDEPGPSDLYDLVKMNVESGEWAEVDGIFTMLKVMAGELEESVVPSFARVASQGGTGVVRRALEIRDSGEASPEISTEIERLLAIIAPRRDVLDVISRPEEEAAIGTPHLARTAPYQGSACVDLEADAYRFKESDVETDLFCFWGRSITIEGQEYSVYYPTFWKDNEEQMEWVDRAFDAIRDAVPVYRQYGMMEDVYVAFSQRTKFSEEDEYTAALQVYTKPGQACPIVMYKLSLSEGSDLFKFDLAHELFHCFEDWNMTTKTYSEHRWWAEGSAEYFANLVYPSINHEHRWTQDFNVNSATKSLMQMDYENVVFFQHFGNFYGNTNLISILKTMSASGKIPLQKEVLASLESFPTMFQDLFVTLYSTGVPDSGGGVIRPDYMHLPVRTEIAEEDIYSFETKDFVGARYSMKYEKEKRFIQSPEENIEGQFSMVLLSERSKKEAWSEMPPEIRSYCDDEIGFVMVLTTIDPLYVVKANVSKVEVADCDPCLLGAWDVNTERFEDYMLLQMSVTGAVQGDIIVSGHYYLNFDEKGAISALKDDFAFHFLYENLGGQAGDQTISMVGNTHGDGTYSADGETFQLLSWSEFVDDATAIIEGGQVVVTVDAEETITASSLFGTQMDAPAGGLVTSESDTSGIQSLPYTCGLHTLEINAPTGSVEFFRVEQIPPTAVPTTIPDSELESP